MTFQILLPLFPHAAPLFRRGQWIILKRQSKSRRFKLLALPNSWGRGQVRTVRWRLYQLAGKVVRHADAVVLKVQARLWTLCDEIRTRCAEAARA